MVYLGLLKTKQRFLSIHFLLIFFGFGKELKRILGKEKKKIPSYFLLDCLDFLALCNRKNDLTIFETRLLQFFALWNCLKKVRLMSILCSFFLRWKPRCSNRILHFLDGGLELILYTLRQKLDFGTKTRFVLNLELELSFNFQTFCNVWSKLNLLSKMSYFAPVCRSYSTFVFLPLLAPSTRQIVRSSLLYPYMCNMHYHQIAFSRQKNRHKNREVPKCIFRLATHLKTCHYCQVDNGRGRYHYTGGGQGERSRRLRPQQCPGCAALRQRNVTGWHGRGSRAAGTAVGPAGAMVGCA